MNENIKVGGDIHAGDGGYSIGTKEKYDEFVKNRNRMNERIKELYVKAYGYFPAPIGEPELEKFAELIVRECISNVEVWEKDSRNHISYMLKQHFGVE